MDISIQCSPPQVNCYVLNGWSELIHLSLAKLMKILISVDLYMCGRQFAYLEVYYFTLA